MGFMKKKNHQYSVITLSKDLILKVINWFKTFSFGTRIDASLLPFFCIVSVNFFLTTGADFQ